MCDAANGSGSWNRTGASVGAGSLPVEDYTREESNLQPSVPKKGAGVPPNATEGLIGSQDTAIRLIRKVSCGNAGFCVRF